MKEQSENRPFFAQGGEVPSPLPEYSEEQGDTQVQTGDRKWALQLQRRGAAVFLAIGSIGPALGRPEGFALYVELVPQGLEHVYRWLTRQAKEMREEGGADE